MPVSVDRDLSNRGAVGDQFGVFLRIRGIRDALSEIVDRRDIAVGSKITIFPVVRICNEWPTLCKMK